MARWFYGRGLGAPRARAVCPGSVLVAGALALLAFCCGAAAQGEAYPSRVVRIVAPFPPAGAADLLSRILAEEIGPTLGQNVIVENRAGAGGRVGTEAVVRSPPDGYTLLMASQATNAINPALYNLNFDPAKDLVSVAPVASVASVLVVNPSVKANTLQELLALARAEPGKLTFGSAGIGGATHLAMELLENLAKVDLTHVPYRGTAPAMTDVLGGRINMMFDTLPTALPHIQSGGVRALAVSTPQRHPVLPDVPTAAEAGVTGYDAVGWYGIFAPAGTPEPIVASLSSVIKTALAKPEFRARLTAQGVDPLPGDPAEFQAFVARDRARWTDLIRAANIKAE
jgi:tripartite-type tricarboxylate transporter receptor subunit TctC